MSKYDLARKNLDHVSFAGGNPLDSNLSHPSLRHAHPEDAQLQNTDLGESHLRGAHLNRAHVTGAILRNVNLTKADLRGVNLDRAATAEGATLRGARGVPPERPEDRVMRMRWNDDGEAAEVVYVARHLARASGFHDADWTTALTEQERQWYRGDARAAIAAIREHERAHATGSHPRPEAVSGDLG